MPFSDAVVGRDHDHRDISAESFKIDELRHDAALAVDPFPGRLYLSFGFDDPIAIVPIKKSCN